MDASVFSWPSCRECRRDHRSGKQTQQKPTVVSDRGYREYLTDYTPTASASDGQEDSEAGTIVESYAFRLTQSTPGKAEPDLGERFCEAMAHDPGEPAPDPHAVLCHVTQGEAAEPPGDESIPIATVEVLDGQHLGAVDECGVRARIYSQATLLKIISCLISKIDGRWR